MWYCQERASIYKVFHAKFATVIHGLTRIWELRNFIWEFKISLLITVMLKLHSRLICSFLHPTGIAMDCLLQAKDTKAINEFTMSY